MGPDVSKDHISFIFKGSWLFFMNLEPLKMKVTHSLEASEVPSPAIQCHIPADKVLITPLHNLKTHTYRLHVLALNYCISTNNDPRDTAG
jgi:hypothetical protein